MSKGTNDGVGAGMRENRKFEPPEHWREVG